jgi:hypothetical protein
MQCGKLQVGFGHVVVFLHRNSNAEVAAAATITDLQQASYALQGKGGPDPFPAALQVRVLHARMLCLCDPQLQAVCTHLEFRVAAGNLTGVSG